MSVLHVFVLQKNGFLTNQFMEILQIPNYFKRFFNNLKFCFETDDNNT